jgi:hypothetical protein
MTDARNKKTEGKIERRRALKALTAGGALAGVSSLPQRWSKPVIDSIVLPAHAETTDGSGSLPGEEPTTTPDPCSVNCNLYVDMNWNHSYEMSVYRDVMLEVLTPGGTRISPKGAQRGRCLELKGHDGAVYSGSGHISNINPGKVAPGRYLLFVTLGSGSGYVSLNASASSDCGNKAATSFGLSDTGAFQFGSIDVSTGGTVVVRVSD